MKAIETEYKGFRFRSRQEARWAVFFDFLDVPWEYEIEGYELSSGRYLPDFWLPELDCFFEVKGSQPSESDIKKAIELSADSLKLVALASGQTKTEPLRFATTQIEWPVEGFQIQLFAGNSSSVWSCKSFDFSMWNWQLDDDLPPFITEQFPSVNIEIENLEKKRQILIECDNKYYKSKYGKEHPRYINGRHEKRVYFVSDQKLGLRFALEPESEPSVISKGYSKAISARFEYGESGA